jgi:parallel beta-helix repeat protein
LVDGNSCLNNAGSDSIQPCENYSIYVTGTENTIIGNTCNNGKETNKSYSIYVGGDKNTITGNTCRAFASGESYGVLTCGKYNTITGNTFSNSSRYNDSYGILAEDTGSTIIGNTCNNSSNYGDSYGIYLRGNGNNTIIGNTFSNTSGANSYGICLMCGYNIVSSNIFRNSRVSGQSASNTFAIWCSGYVSHTVIHGNNLRFVTGLATPGSAYTTDGASVATLPGSAATIAALGTGGSCGFNIV